MRSLKLSRSVLLGGCSAIALVCASAAAQAGGYAVREQSTEFQGMSFAGNAAPGGGISSMYWNPATVAHAPAGLTVEAHGALVLPNSTITGTSTIGGVPTAVSGIGSGQYAPEAIVPSSYTTFRMTQDLAFGFNVNAPFGFRNGSSNNVWAGQSFARESQIRTMNYQASVGYRVAPWLSIGAGVQLQTIRARLVNASGTTAASTDVTVEGSDRELGWSAGLTLTPLSGTQIGLGYRSQISHQLDGGANITGPASAFGTATVRGNTTTPETATLSLRQALAPQLTLLGSVEWTGWSRLVSLDIFCPGQANAVFCPAGNGQNVRSLALGWHDGWMYSLGLEYQVMPSLTLRAGGAYEKSPIQNATERTLRVPDADRIWGSVGATYKLNNAMSFDLAYTHIWVDDAPIDRTESGVRFVGNANTSLDIISASFKWKLGAVAHEPTSLK